MLPLTAIETAELVGKFVRRNGLAESVEGTLLAEVARPEYASLAQVPVTLNLLLHVLAKEGADGAVLSRSGLYDRAVRMMVQVALPQFAVELSIAMSHLSCQMPLRT